MDRVLEPEWLDQLPLSDPRAAHSRRDLRVVNFIMGNARRVCTALGKPRSMLDLGSGDGAFARRIAGDADLTLVDLAGGEGVVRADALEFLARPGARYDVIVANLFLHHLDEASIARLLELASSRCDRFVACEPRRGRLAMIGSRLLWLLGCNDVTRHDAVVSVRAGFSGTELSALWPRDARWRLEERFAAPFSHLFVARRAAL